MICRENCIFAQDEAFACPLCNTYGRMGKQYKTFRSPTTSASGEGLADSAVASCVAPRRSLGRVETYIALFYPFHQFKLLVDLVRTCNPIWYQSGRSQVQTPVKAVLKKNTKNTCSLKKKNLWAKNDPRLWLRSLDVRGRVETYIALFYPFHQFGLLG